MKTCGELLFFPNNFRSEFSILDHCALFKLGFDFDGAEESPTFCCWFLLLLFPGKLKGRLPAPPLEFPAVPEPPGSISGRNFGFLVVFCQKVPNSVHFLLFLHRDNFTTNWRSKVLFEIIIYRSIYNIQKEENKISLRKTKTKYSTVVFWQFFFDVSSGSGFWRAKRVHNSSAIGHVYVCENRDVSWARINFHDEVKN